MKTFKEFIKLAEQSTSGIMDAEFTNSIKRSSSAGLASKLLPIVSKLEPHVYAAALGLNAGKTAQGKVPVKGSDGKTYYMDK